MEDYSHDYTEDLSFFPELVLKPSTTEKVSRLLLIVINANACYSCGARTGLSGGSLPVCGGIAMSMERFDTIIEIDERNLQAVEPGVINQVLEMR